MPPKRACERTPHSDWHSLQAPREGPLEGCMRSHHWRLHVRPPQEESQTLRREAPHPGTASHTLHWPRGALLSPQRGEGLSGSPRAPRGPCTCLCERLHQNSSASEQALTARRHPLSTCGTSWLQADTLCRTQLCSWQTAGPDQRRACTSPGNAFPAAVAHLVLLCHTLETLTLLQTSSL